jgi:hypothetical protein
LDLAKNPQEIIYRKLELAREEDKQSAARTKAIHMTILAYGLEPASWSGTSVMPMTKKRTITWMPVARESEARQVQSADGSLQDVKQDKKDYVGLTYQDGVTVLPPKAFEKGPGYLASILLHERTHFEQITTDGKGNVMSYAEAQKEAYQTQVKNGSYFFDVKNEKERKTKEGIEGLLATEVGNVEDEIKASIEARKGLKGLIRRFIPPAAPPDIFESRIHTNAELADISGLVAQARAQADISRRDREEREANAKEARRIDQARESFQEALREQLREDQRARVAEKTLRLSERHPPEHAPVQALRPNSFSTVLPQFKEFAVAACLAPEQVAIETYLHRDYDFSSRERDDNLARGLAADLGDCPRQLFYQLIKTHRAMEYGRIDRQWIRTMVAAYSRAPDTSSGYTPPPPRTCESYGNQRCP